MSAAKLQDPELLMSGLVFREQEILPSAEFSGDEFLHAGFGGVYGVDLHFELSGGRGTGEAFDGQQSEGFPGLGSHAFLYGLHAASEQIELLELIELFFEFSDLVFGAAVAVSEALSGEIFVAGVGFAVTSPRDGAEPCPEASATGMFEALNLCQHHKEGVVGEVFSVGGLESFPAGPLVEN
jgi:hypothetical protein